MALVQTQTTIGNTPTVILTGVTIAKYITERKSNGSQPQKLIFHHHDPHQRPHEYDSLYNATLTEEDMTGQDGVSLAELQAIFTTLAAIDALMAAGHETNLEKGK
jgi:poly(A) polymerase Pap1